MNDKYGRKGLAFGGTDKISRKIAGPRVEIRTRDFPVKQE
jgi:hypothetical protein